MSIIKVTINVEITDAQGQGSTFTRKRIRAVGDNSTFYAKDAMHLAGLTLDDVELSLVALHGDIRQAATS